MRLPPFVPHVSLHLHPALPTVHAPRRLAVCAVVGTAALTAPSAAALDVPDPGPPVSTSAPVSASPPPPPANVARVASTGAAATTTEKAVAKKKAKKLRFAKRAEAIVTIKSVRISRYVYRGGQRTIDKAVVAHYTGWPGTFAAAGKPGVYWLAAHNYGTYGPFHRLLKVKKGARVAVTTRSGHRYVYKVTRLRIVGTVIPKGVVWGRWAPTRGPSRAVLQTCVGSKRLLVYASLVSRS